MKNVVHFIVVFQLKYHWNETWNNICLTIFVMNYEMDVLYFQSRCHCLSICHIFCLVGILRNTTFFLSGWYWNFVWVAVTKFHLTVNIYESAYEKVYTVYSLKEAAQKWQNYAYFISIHLLTTKRCHAVNFVVTDNTAGCHFDSSEMLVVSMMAWYVIGPGKWGSNFIKYNFKLIM